MLVRLAPSRDALDATLGLPAGSFPYRMTVGPDGNLWVTTIRAAAIDRVTPAGARTRFTLAEDHFTVDIVAGPDGALWFTELGANVIGRITTGGQVTEFPVPTAGAQPFGITIGQDGAIWFSEFNANQLGRLQLDSPRSAGGPGGSGGGPGGSAVVADRAAPVFVRALSLSRSRFRASAAASRPTPRGSEFRFSLSEPARVVITIAKGSSGRRVGGVCVRPTRSNRGRSRCTRYATVGRLRRDGRQGPNEVAFTGRLNGRALRGTYRATAVATDAVGNVSRPSRVTFAVVSR